MRQKLHRIRASERTCDGCSACCLTHPIAEISKPAGEWCPHCTTQRRCDAYKQRPPGCRDFECQWLLGVGALSDKPTSSGVVMDIFPLPGIGPTFMLFEVIPGALQGELARRETADHINREEAVCHMPLIGEYTLFLPMSWFMKFGVINGTLNGHSCKVVYRKPTL